MNKMTDNGTWYLELIVLGRIYASDNVIWDSRKRKDFIAEYVEETTSELSKHPLPRLHVISKVC